MCVIGLSHLTNHILTAKYRQRLLIHITCTANYPITSTVGKHLEVEASLQMGKLMLLQIILSMINTLI